MSFSIKELVAGDVSAVRVALQNGLDPNQSLSMALDVDSFTYGPTLLYVACIVPNADMLVAEMLKCGGNPQAEWAYETDWDPDDCYFRTRKVEVLRAIRAFHAGAKDYLHLCYLDGNLQPQMRDLGLFSPGGEPLYGQPSDKVMELLAQ